MNLEIFNLNIEKLPMVIELETKGIKKSYIIKPNKEKTGVFLNKLEQY